MQVVTENTPFADGIVAINNFGFGGTNVHLVMKGSTRKDAILDDTGSGKYSLQMHHSCACILFRLDTLQLQSVFFLTFFSGGR